VRRRADDRQHAGHADPDAAGHGLFDRDLGDRPGGAGLLGHRPQHRHRPAGIDDGRVAAIVITSGSTSLTHPRVPADPSSVVTSTASRSRGQVDPKSRSAVAAPRTISDVVPRSRSTWASQKSGALP
jgi:hypothetical protein